MLTQNLRVSFFKKIALLAFIASFVYSAFAVVDNIFFVGFDLIKELYFYSGVFALIFLNLSVFFSLFHFKKTKIYPKMLGIFAGIWVFIHFFVYFVFSRNLSLVRLWDDVSHRLFEASGFVAFVVILLMFLSSFERFKRLNPVRKLGYLCLVIASYHFFLSAKVPMIAEYSALTIALIYFTVRYTLKRKRSGG